MNILHLQKKEQIEAKNASYDLIALIVVVIAGLLFLYGVLELVYDRIFSLIPSNPQLDYVFIVVGSIGLAVGFFFLVLLDKKPKD